jgi:tetratricopeptide (TPR) repeat protein
MAEDERSRASMDSGAWAALGAASREKADAWLEEQTVLARLQAADLRREDSVRHWSLRVHHVSDVLKLAFELALALIFTSVVAVIAVAFWEAAHDDGLVIEAFKVPADMAGKGLTGDVVASQLLDRLTDLQAKTDSSRAPSTYSSGWGSDIKVEIPDTGISIREAYRYLAGWLGHQTHISGEVYRTETGIALTARVGGNAGARFEGSERDLDKLIGRAAESVYGETQPFRYAVYLTSHGRNDEEAVVLRDLALNGPDSEKPWAYTVWAYDPILTGDLATALYRTRKAVELAPDLPLAQDDLSVMEGLAGHEEREYQSALATEKSLQGNGAHQIIARAAKATDTETEAEIAEELGDFGAAVKQYEALGDAADFEGSQWMSVRMGAADAALAHDVSGSRQLLGKLQDADLIPLAINGFGWQLPNFRLAQFEQFVALGDWQAARKDAERTLSRPEARLPNALVFIRTQVWPWLALAQARSGDVKSAHALIGKTPLDCYLCVRMRGTIEASRKNWSGAGRWLANAVQQAPSLPFAYSEWGQMLMAKGDYDGAIAKFTLANQKGPHFADPLEMWGEALILKNRSDLAPARFEVAAKYAPNWGRLHLKWGEALWWIGKKDEARKQFAIAAALDLTASEKSELAKVSHGG